MYSLKIADNVRPQSSIDNVLSAVLIRIYEYADYAVDG